MFCAMYQDPQQRQALQGSDLRPGGLSMYWERIGDGHRRTESEDRPGSARDFPPTSEPLSRTRTSAQKLHDAGCVLHLRDRPQGHQPRTPGSPHWCVAALQACISCTSPLSA